MSGKYMRHVLMLLLVPVFVVMVVACCSQDRETTEAETPVETAQVETEVAPVVAATMHTEVLAKADALDGTTDQIVSKCPGCAFAMDGKPENQIEVDGYTMQFCLEECKVAFEENLEAALAALEVPAPVIE
jgi:hypothetical protein